MQPSESLTGQKIIVTRLKLEIPCSYDNEQQGYGKDWFKNITGKQEDMLKEVLNEYSIAYDERYEEKADEADTACQQKFYTVSYKVSSDKLQSELLKVARKFFEIVKKAGFPAFFSPLLIFPTGECFSPNIITCQNDVVAGALFFGNIQGGVYLNHWEISMDSLEASPPQRSSDKIFVNFEYDKEDLIAATFQCVKRKSREESVKVMYKITIQRKNIRRIIIDNAVHDKFGSGRTRMNLELTTPFIITECLVGHNKKGQEPKFNRETTIKHGRKENEYPKDADLTDCPFFTVEFAQKIENKKIFSIISRLRARTSLAIEFGTFPIVDAIMKMGRPYFEWLGNTLPTAKTCDYYQEFLEICFPRTSIKDENDYEENERRRFVITFLIECLLSRGPIVKDQLCLQRVHWDRFLKIVAMLIIQNFGRAERSLERLVTMIDERKRIGSINKTLILIFEAITAEDTNPLTISTGAEETREGYQRVRKVIITPTRTVYVVPELMMSNRVLRRFDPDGTNVLRVAFRDDNGNKMRSSTTADSRIERVVGEKLKCGMIIAGRNFGYLGSSNSQMRDHGAYFMQKMSDDDVREYKKNNTDDPPRNMMPQITNVRERLGKFDKIESIPKLMARLGQCFTQSKESGVALPLDNCAYTYDVVGGVNSMGVEFTFTDGVGMISESFAVKVARDFGITQGRPSCYQFRYRGMKGVLGVDNYLDEHNNWVRKKDRGPPPKPLCNSWIVDIALRPSQEKFHGARQENIEIVKVSSPSPVSLNRPFINILDQVSMMQGYHVHKRMTARIEYLLDRQMRGFATQMIDETTCRNRLKELPRRIDIDKLSTSAGFEMSSEVFFRSLIKASVKFSVSKQLSKAQIQIPFECGRTLLGIADETGRLQYGQIYCQVTKSIRDKFPHPNAAKMVLKGKVLLTKNPCIVAGDVRIFEAIDIPELHHLVDVIVFPRHGPRPHPDEMAG